MQIGDGRRFFFFTFKMKYLFKNWGSWMGKLFYFISEGGPEGGGGGYSDFVLTGLAAQASKTLPIFKGLFGRKWYP